MQLNHINLTVADVSKTRTFFETYFGLKRIFESGDSLAVLADDNKHCIVALNNFDKATKVAYPKGFHIGFFQESRQQVDAIFERLKADGFELGQRKEFDGAWTFYFESPGGFTIEVAHRQVAGN